MEKNGDFFDNAYDELEDFILLIIGENEKNKYDNIYMQMKKKIKTKPELKEYIRTNFVVSFDNNIFILFRNPQNQNDFCILTLEKENRKLTILNSRNINKFLDECTYFYEYNEETNLSIETSGLTQEKKKNFTITWEKNNIKYTFTLKENEDKTYQYEMESQSEQKKYIICTWDNYEQFLKTNPKKININGTNINNVEDEKIYKEIKKYIEKLGLFLNFEVLRDYTKYGIRVNNIFEKLIKAYISIQNRINKFKIEEERNNEESEKRRHNIDVTINENPQRETNAIIELAHLTRRNSINVHKKR